MKLCTKCILPETFPGIHFDEDGVCNFCKTATPKDTQGGKNDFQNEDELAQYLSKYRNTPGKYDVVVPISGGVDSSFALIQIVEKYKLRPLVFHNDHGFEDEVATANVRKLCAKLNVDLILWQHDFGFMKKLWKYINEADVQGLSTCYVCGNILYLNALELANRFQIPLIINGYSKGQSAIIHDKDKGNELLEKLLEIIRKTGDREFFNEYMRKYEVLQKQIIYTNKADLEQGVNYEKIMVIPFFIFKFYETNKEELKKKCMEIFDWQSMPTSYPARTTNCKMIWLNTYMDLQKMNYSVYNNEYAELVRAGEMTREQALADLEFNPPAGLLEYLALEVGVDLHKFKNRQVESTAQVQNADLDKADKKKLDIDFDF